MSSSLIDKNIYNKICPICGELREKGELVRFGWREDQQSDEDYPHAELVDCVRYLGQALARANERLDSHRL